MAPRTKSLFEIVCAANQGKGVHFILPRHLHRLRDGSLDRPAVLFNYITPGIYRLWDCTIGSRYLAINAQEQRSWGDAFLELLQGGGLARYLELAILDEPTAEKLQAIETRIGDEITAAQTGDPEFWTPTCETPEEWLYQRGLLSRDRLLELAS
jgi:hypothetical protein